MRHYIYLILSTVKNKTISYVGYTNNLKRRLNLHNSGKGAKFTKGRKWKMIYKEKYLTKQEAIQREYYIKKNRKFRNIVKKRFYEKKNSNIAPI